MKTRNLLSLFGLLFLASVLLQTGCATTGTSSGPIIQRVLDAALPQSFRGDAHVEHKNALVDVTIRAGDLRYEEGRWVWSWLTYKRNGRASHGDIRLGAPPASEVPPL